jgi:hypothetical protein
MAKRLNKTLLDYLVIAISPAMIILLIDSLVLFLIEVFYRGNYNGRLDYVFTLFVIGAVLIGRISIEDGRERAILFSIPLAIAILLVTYKFVEFQGALAPFSFFINCGLIALVWWSADKLTWDCTLIDEQEEDSGEGLLETVGFDRPDHAAIQREIAPKVGAAPNVGAAVALPPRERGKRGSSATATPTNRATATPTMPEPAKEIEATTSRDGPPSWWDRFIERRRRPHAPGVWVVYFSLAALPLFGLGQLFIPDSNTDARQYAFQLLFIYTASGLGLLLSTSFLGMRRYLRQRRQEMLLRMVNLWLGTGVALIVVVMFAAMLLPRPNAEYAISDLPIQIGSPGQHSSAYGTGQEGVEEDQPDARLEPRDDAKPDAPQSDQPGDAKASSGDNDKSKSANNDQKASNDQQKPDKPGEKGDARRQTPNQPQEKRSTSEKQPQDDQTKPKQGQPPDQNSDKKAKPDRSDANDKKSPADSARKQGKTADKRPPDDQAKDKRGQPSDRDTEKSKPSQGAGSAEAQPLKKLPEKSPERREGGQARTANHPRMPSAPHMSFPHALFSFGALLKWVLYLALALLLAWAIWKNRAELLAALRDFRQMLTDLWNRLFGGKAREAAEAVAEEVGKQRPLPRFADYKDPFASGVAGRYRPEELVQYTFEALEAWARDTGHSRLPDQTPHEFARCLGTEASSLSADATYLAELYCQVAYAHASPAAASVGRLSQLWQGMRAAVVRPASAAAK